MIRKSGPRLPSDWWMAYMTSLLPRKFFQSRDIRKNLYRSHLNMFQNLFTLFLSRLVRTAQNLGSCLLLNMNAWWVQRWKWIGHWLLFGDGSEPATGYYFPVSESNVCTFLSNPSCPFPVPLNLPWTSPVNTVVSCAEYISSHLAFLVPLEQTWEPL